MMKWIILLAGLFIATTSLCQQPGISNNPHQLLHENIKAELDNIYALFKKYEVADSFRKVDENGLLLKGLFNRIDGIETDLEGNLSLDSSRQLIFLAGLRYALHEFAHSYRLKQLKAVQLEDLLEAYNEALRLELVSSSIFPVISKNDALIGAILVACPTFNNNIGIQQGKDFVARKVFQTQPGYILSVLFDNPDVSMADSIILAIARNQARQLYTFAQSSNSGLGKRIKKLDDPLVKLIYRLAQMSEGQLYLPFADDLLHGKISMNDIKTSLEDTNHIQYYKLLVKTEISYAGRVQKNDTPVAMLSLTRMLGTIAVDDFVKKINALHDTLDLIRMKITEHLTPQELYYLIVMSENDLYTSTYLKIYTKIFKHSGIRDSYDFLSSVNFDRSKKMIKLAANYNTLGDFLSRMDKNKAAGIIESFPGGLEHSDNLEDAVDVADSYASISDSRLRLTILREIKKNLSLVTSSNSERGRKIYSLLQSLFLSLDPANHIDLSSLFGIPSVYRINNSTLRDSSGNIIIQQFIYGDKDGRKEYGNFINAYRRPGWKIEMDEEWVKITSTSGIPVSIYSNLPLDDTTEMDAKAQADLGEYLVGSGLHPTIVIHRGHSYHVKYTIEQLAPSAKVVLLGSCGGYNNIAGVLTVCPYAHIVATKQEGRGSINQPMIEYLTELLRQGKDLDWPSIWKSLSIKFKQDGKFKDYIPPHKNLGAIFLMAYNKTTVSLK